MRSPDVTLARPATFDQCKGQTSKYGPNSRFESLNVCLVRVCLADYFHLTLAKANKPKGALTFDSPDGLTSERAHQSEADWPPRIPCCCRCYVSCRAQRLLDDWTASSWLPSRPRTLAVAHRRPPGGGGQSRRTSASQCDNKKMPLSFELARRPPSDQLVNLDLQASQTERNRWIMNKPASGAVQPLDFGDVLGLFTHGSLPFAGRRLVVPVLVWCLPPQESGRTCTAAPLPGSGAGPTRLHCCRSSSTPPLPLQVLCNPTPLEVRL